MVATQISRQGRSTWLWWTAGADAAWALYVLRSDPVWQVGGLVTAVSGFDGRAIGHGVPKELMEEQAAAAGLPLMVFECAARGAGFNVCDGDFRRAFCDLRRQGAEVIAFGDLAPSDRTRPVALLAGTGLTPAFPLAGLDPQQHAEAMLTGGMSAWVCAVDTTDVPPGLVGRRFDRSLLADLPGHVDPCRKNSAFGTFAEWTPGWNRRVSVVPTGSIECHGFAFADLRPLRSGAIEANPDDSVDAATGAPPDPFDYFERLVRVRRFVDERIGEDLSIEGVAAVAALAPTSFGRYFRQRTGMTFRSWLARYRVRRACRMLRESDTPVNEVGRAVGFRCSRSFRRVFRNLTGASPSQYRKRVLPDTSAPTKADS